MMPNSPSTDGDKPSDSLQIQADRFVPADRFKQKQSVAALRKLAEASLLAANKERVAALDGEGEISTTFITRKESIAAVAQTEIILRSIFS